jgi:hypothetical protein
MACHGMCLWRPLACESTLPPREHSKMSMTTPNRTTRVIKVPVSQCAGTGPESKRRARDRDRSSARDRSPDFKRFPFLFDRLRTEAHPLLPLFFNTGRPSSTFGFHSDFSFFFFLFLFLFLFFLYVLIFNFLFFSIFF